MPAGDSPDVLVARFLRASNYHETFEAFVRETNLSPSSITNNPTDLTIEKILEEKKLYDLALRFEKISINANDVDFSLPHPTTSTTLTTASTSSNILSITLATLNIASPGQTNSPKQAIISTSSDKLLRIYPATAPYDCIATLQPLHPSPILSVLPLSQEWLLTASMSGDIAISTLRGDVLQRWEGHKKYIVKLAISDPLPESNEQEEVRYLAAASYDKSLSIHKLSIPVAASSSSLPDDGIEIDPVIPKLTFLQIIQFPQTVEDVIFSQNHQDSSHSLSSQLLIATIRDSAYLHIFSPSPDADADTSTAPNPFTLLSKTPLNATSTTWLTYTPTSLTTHPHHPHLLSLITSSLPSPKIIIYNLSTMTVDKEFTVPVQLSAYSTGIIVWRSDDSASGLWVNGDDGVVKGVEVKSGGVKVELNGHNGRKVRCLAAGVVDGEEVLISGGFDGGLNVWKVGKEAAA
ncbi:hypothetical protein ABW19_dt0205980 [Dactylella cylindrospora]|nr:hypothetical protein ABW19_dt0205980 [Dactylella cylindrospora]